MKLNISAWLMIPVVVCAIVVVTNNVSLVQSNQSVATQSVNSTPQPCGTNTRINEAVFSPDSKSILSTWSPGQARLWDVQSGNYLRSFTNPSNFLFYHVAFSPNGQYVL